MCSPEFHKGHDPTSGDIGHILLALVGCAFIGMVVICMVLFLIHTWTQL